MHGLECVETDSLISARLHLLTVCLRGIKGFPMVCVSQLPINMGRNKTVYKWHFLHFDCYFVFVFSARCIPDFTQGNPGQCCRRMCQLCGGGYQHLFRGSVTVRQAFNLLAERRGRVYKVVQHRKSIGLYVPVE